MSERRAPAPFSKTRTGRPVGARNLWRSGRARPSDKWLRYRACCVGPYICEARQAAEVSVEELAARLGVSRSCVHRWESGRSAPSLLHLVAVAAVLGTRVSDLVTGCDP